MTHCWYDPLKVWNTYFQFCCEVIVASKFNAKPHTIICKPHGVISCESICPNWASLQICSHSVATARFNCELENFLEKYRKKFFPNLMKLAKVGMPRGASKKGDLSPKKRKSAQTITKNVAPSCFTPSSQPKDKRSLASQGSLQTVTSATQQTVTTTAT